MTTKEKFQQHLGVSEADRDNHLMVSQSIAPMTLSWESGG